MMWDGGWTWGGWVLMSVMMIGFWALIVWAVLAFVGSFRDREPHESRRPRDLDPEEILAGRFARGEIDVEEYHRRLEALRAPEHEGQRVGAGRR